MGLCYVKTVLITKWQEMNSHWRDPHCISEKRVPLFVTQFQNPSDSKHGEEVTQNKGRKQMEKVCFGTIV